MQTLDLVKAGVAGAAGLLASASIQAAPPAEHPKPVHLAAKEKVAELAAASRARGSLDVTPPELTRLRVSGNLDVGQSGQFIEVDVGIQDDLSGMYGYYLVLRAPSDTLYYYGPGVSMPSRHYRATLDLGYGIPTYYSSPFSRFSEPGTWAVDRVFVYDLAGNGREYAGSELAALGNLQFKVRNAAGFDTVAPALQSGAIGTKSVSLSRAPAGTAEGTAPFVYADLTLSDSGNTVVSGMLSANLYFCHQDSAGNCDASLWLSGQLTRQGVSNSVLRVAGQAYGAPRTGKYHLNYVYLADAAGNTTYLTSTRFGGFTDFSTYFPSTTITIKP